MKPLVGMALVAMAGLAGPGAMRWSAAADPAGAKPLRVIPLKGEAVQAAMEGVRPATQPRAAATQPSLPGAGAWIGLRLGLVPEALAAHILGPDPDPAAAATRPAAGVSRAAGLMVLNVNLGGPADKAGVQQFDVITAAGGQALPADFDAFNDRLRQHRPGDRLVLSLYRGGRTFQAPVTLEAPPADPVARFKYAAEAGDGLDGSIFVKRNQAWQKMEPAQATLFLDQLPPDVRRMFLDRLRADLRPPVVAKASRVIDDHKTVQVSLDQQGRVTVRTLVKDRDGRVTETMREYASADAVRADPVAYGVLTSALHSRRVPVGGTAAGPSAPPGGDEPDSTKGPKYRFRVDQASGAITVISLDGTVELLFKSEAELRSAKPRLHEEFRAAMKRMEAP